MSTAKHMILAEKALHACIAAIEVYNKPAFKYREETFAILMINAWELLLKARVLKENGNRMRSIEMIETKARKDGTAGSRKQVKRGRSGNAFTIGLRRASELVRQYEKDAIDQRCIDNLELLVEIRDCAVHLYNKTRSLAMRVHEVGTASLRNFAHASKTWFGTDLRDHSLALMPISFDTPAGAIEAVVPDDEKTAVGRLLRRIMADQSANPFDDSAPYNVAIRVQVQFVRKATDNATPVQVTRGDASAVKVVISEEEALKAFPWNYNTLCREARKRYADFKEDKKFVIHRRRLEKDERFCKTRHLDPSRPVKSLEKRFYSANIMQELDKLYSRKAA